MAQAQLYKHDISRPLNPAVSVTDDSASTVNVEIEEYVFTDEILNGLYSILDAVRQRSVDHTGIWINGYYGSGKSHFLKYLNFCLNPAHRDRALERVLEAVKLFDPLSNPDSKLANTPSDFRQLVDWLGKAEIDSIMFNIGDKVGDRATSNSTTFASAIWEEFNAFRGFNKFDIALAQYLEKPLKEKGKFEAFEAALAEDGYDWKTQAETLAITELDYVLEKAAEVTTLSTDIIRKQIAESGINATPEKLSLEIKSYLASKSSNYRLLVFIDEVSQFIGTRQELLLQLQQIVTTLAKDCDKRVWVGCTAQQDLSEVIEGCHIVDTSDQYGKIMGRFQTRVALQGTNTEYITQKRILDKDEDAIVELGKLYNAKQAALDSQFSLPTGYRKYADKQDFINYYPFVPYQFQLIMNVFDAFVALEYVDTEVKGNERSVLKVTHKTAQDHKEDKIGDLISFDMLFGSMFEAGLKHDGQQAIKNANQIISTYSDKAFGQRVVNLLFMICNISDRNKLLFPATLENITTLMMTEIDQNKLALRDKIKNVLDYLKDNSIVRVETKDGTSTEVYCFLTEEESEVNHLIKNQTINNNAMAEALKSIFVRHITLSNRESFNGNSFNIAISIMDRNIIGAANANLFVDFKIDSSYANVNQFAFSNDSKRMVYYLSDLYSSNSKLKNDFYWYCQVLEYLKSNALNSSEQRTRTNDEFRSRASELLIKSIQPEFDKILDSCPIVSGTQVIQPAILGSKKATDRYKTAIAEHFNNVYPLASYIKSNEVPTTADALKAKIRRPIGENEYGPINPLTNAENEIEQYLNRSAGDPLLADVITTFSQPPYGWNEIATVFFVNELVRRHMRAYSYKSNPNVDKNIVADNVLRDRNSFTITSAQMVDPQVVSDFIKAWKYIFNDFGSTYSLDSTELFSQCHNDSNSPLSKLPINFAQYSGDLKANHADSLAKILDDAIDKLNNSWKAERDPEKFFKLVTAEKEEGKKMMDECKDVLAFHQNQLPNFKEIYDYAEDNHDNFSFIKDPEDKKLVEELEAIFKDPRPDQTLPIYKKRRDLLKGKLADIKVVLVKAVEDAYAKALDELEAFAKSNGVDFDRDSFRNVTVSKTSTNNFYALQSAANTNAFKQEQIDIILKKTQKPNVTVKKAHVFFNQICKPQSIHNAAEIDAYVDDIKKKLFEKLADNDVLIVS